MNLPPCQMEERDGQMWCLDCQRFHVGHTADIARDPGEKGQKYRALWRKSRAASTRPLLRPLPIAQQCQHLGERLTHAEVKEKQLVGCRTCTNEVPAFHCKLPNAKKFNGGPYTRLADCMACADWQAKASHENPALTTGFSRSQQYQIDEAVGYAHQGPKQHLATMKQHQTNEKKVVPLTVLESRLAVCRSGVCGRMKRDTCDMAGFALSNERFSWAVSSCPMGLWSTYVDSREHDTKPALSHLPG